MIMVLLIYEDEHGVIGAATSLKAAKQFLLRHKWATGHSYTWVNDRLNENGDHYFHLNEAYGDNWKEAFMGFSNGELGNMGFCVQKSELIEEEN